MRFRDLQIGDTFDFIAPTGYNSFFDRCTKTGKRTYSWDNPRKCSLSPDEKLETRVGSINVEVYHVEPALVNNSYVMTEDDPAAQRFVPKED